MYSLHHVPSYFLIPSVNIEMSSLDLLSDFRQIEILFTANRNLVFSLSCKQFHLLELSPLSLITHRYPHSLRVAEEPKYTGFACGQASANKFLFFSVYSLIFRIMNSPSSTAARAEFAAARLTAAAGTIFTAAAITAADKTFMINKIVLGRVTACTSTPTLARRHASQWRWRSLSVAHLTPLAVFFGESS